jgi:hypothetical protein
LLVRCFQVQSSSSRSTSSSHDSVFSTVPSFRHNAFKRDNVLCFFSFCVFFGQKEPYRRGFKVPSVDHAEEGMPSAGIGESEEQLGGTARFAWRAACTMQSGTSPPPVRCRRRGLLWCAQELCVPSWRHREYLERRRQGRPNGPAARASTGSRPAGQRVRRRVGAVLGAQ